MKKYHLFLLLFVVSIVFAYCSSSKKATSSTAAVTKLTYEGNIQPIIAASCTPCHIPAQGGSKKAFDSYTGVSSSIDDIIARVEMNPGERGFMPFKHPKLSDSTINLLVQWKTGGLLEK